MKEAAEKLNNILKNTCVYSMFSEYGKRMYTPNGIPVQSVQAKEKATVFNATAGVAKENGRVLYMNLVRQYFSEGLTENEILDYAPMGGKPALREAWRKDMVLKNPDLQGKSFSLPLVTGGLTNSLAIAFSLFADSSDSVVIPDMYWENYDLLIEELRGAKKVTFPFFSGNGFNLEGFDKAIGSVKSDKVLVLMNFPNNPTGYTPTHAEAEGICNIIKRHAENGKKIVYICDDAYFSLFYEPDTYKQSLFAKLCDIHPNVLAVKCDGATKEEMVWGFRIAFITYGCKGLGESEYKALMQKTSGVIRTLISSCNSAAQTILEKVLSNPNMPEQRKAGIDKVASHYVAFRKELAKYSDNTDLIPLPFNSGYFMCFKTKCNAEELRMKLLNEYNGGVIYINDDHIRFAFCSVEPENMEKAVSSIYEAASKLN